MPGTGYRWFAVRYIRVSNTQVGRSSGANYTLASRGCDMCVCPSSLINYSSSSCSNQQPKGQGTPPLFTIITVPGTRYNTTPDLPRIFLRASIMFPMRTRAKSRQIHHVVMFIVLTDAAILSNPSRCPVQQSVAASGNPHKQYAMLKH